MPEYVMFIVGDMEKQAKFSQQEGEASTAQVIAWFESTHAAGEFVEGAGRRLEDPRRRRPSTPASATASPSPMAPTRKRRSRSAAMPSSTHRTCRPRSS